MERLTKRDEFGNADIIGVDSADLQMNLEFDEFNKVTDALNKLADYEDAEENGTLIKLPCKVGDTVYVFYERFVDGKIQILEKTIAWIEVYNNKLVISVDGAQYAQSEFNKTFFLTREAAEAALKERQ